MRPEKARNKIDKAIKASLLDESFYPLSKVKREMLKMLLVFSKSEGESACGNYYDDNNSYNTLMYISDRWGCTGRIKWLIHMADTLPKMEVKND